MDCEDFLAGESFLNPARVVRIAPFRRNIYTTLHHTHTADFEEFKWIIQNGSTDVWYEKPGPSSLKRMATLGHDNLPTLENSQPISLETPKIWASAALTTPVDDDIYDCSCCDGFSALDEAASAIADLKREERGSNFYRDVLASIRERNSGEIRRHSRDASEIGNSSETWLPWPFDRVVKSSGIRIGKMTRCFAILAAVSMIMPAAAMDHELVPVGASAVTAAAAAAGAAAANVVDPNHIPTVAAGTCTGILFLCVGYLTGAARSLLGPLMGITSVLWFIMRNDAAIKPGLSWM